MSIITLIPLLVLIFIVSIMVIFKDFYPNSISHEKTVIIPEVEQIDTKILLLTNNLKNFEESIPSIRRILLLNLIKSFSGKYNISLHECIPIFKIKIYSNTVGFNIIYSESNFWKKTAWKFNVVVIESIHNSYHNDETSTILLEDIYLALWYNSYYCNNSNNSYYCNNSNNSYYCNNIDMLSHKMKEQIEDYLNSSKSIFDELLDDM